MKYFEPTGNVFIKTPRLRNAHSSIERPTQFYAYLRILFSKVAFSLGEQTPGWILRRRISECFPRYKSKTESARARRVNTEHAWQAGNHGTRENVAPSATIGSLGKQAEFDASWRRQHDATLRNMFGSFRTHSWPSLAPKLNGLCSTLWASSRLL